MAKNEYCISYSEKEQCMGGELLLAALLIELAFYVISFTFGWKIVDVVRNKLAKREMEKREEEERKNNQKW
tara:strand:+ start:50 stop:262 length:213 start_codon:yes stop_codon:yes gene_type:complete